MRHLRLPTIILLAVSAIATISTGCDDFGNPLDPSTMRDKPFEKKAPEQKANAPGGEPTNQQSAQLEDYQRPVYPNGVRRNPFQPDPAFLIQQAEFETENARVKEPLEEFGIGQLRLAAIISGIAVPKAMFIDPNGLGHFAKVGDRIGEGGMTISAIRENSVTLSSDHNDEEGGEGLSGSTQVIRLSDALGSDEQQLSDEDKAALERILNSSAAKKALQKELGNSPNSGSDNSDNANYPPGSYGGQ